MDFPIYRHIMSGGDVSSAGKRKRVNPSSLPLLRNSVLVEGVDPLDSGDENQFGGNVEEILSRLGPQRPSFPLMWIELGNNVKTPSHDIPDVRGTAIAVSHQTDDEHGEYATHTGFIWYENGTVLMSLIDVVVELNDQGLAVELKMGVQERGFEDQLDDPVSTAGTWHLIYPALYTIGLMNCKNVGTRKGYYRNRSSNPQVRRNSPKFEYHTIVLPHQNSAGGGGKTGTGVAPALHKVRGHFATYTEAAPLFGKHVGTYWVPWHVRGSKDKGLIESRYKVKEK